MRIAIIAPGSRGDVQPYVALGKGLMKAGDEDEVFYLSKYNDEADYKQKVESLRSDEEYISLGRQLEEVRTSFESTKLLPMKPEQPTRH